MPRHGTENLTRNEEELYEEFFEERGVSGITHYRTPRWPPLTTKIRKRLTRQRHIWSLGDRYWNLAHKYYGNPKFWWIIAWYNMSPTEGHLKAGDVVYIPFPLDKILSYFKFGSM